MCVAVPARVVRVDGAMATVDLEGARREVSLQLLDRAEVGDFVIVHAGFAIQKLDEEEAQAALDLLSRMRGL